MKQINLALDTVENREMRLGSITSWTGTASDLVMQSNYEGRSLIKREFDCGKKNGCRLCELEMPFNQQSMCANSIASCQAGNLRDCVLIQHSTVGCTARNPEFNLAMRNGLARRNLEPRNINIVTTNLMENDMVFGASEKLRKTVQKPSFCRCHVLLLSSVKTSPV